VTLLHLWSTSSTSAMHIVPFFSRSLFDDVDSMYDDLLWDSPFGYSLLPARSRQSSIGAAPKNWTATVRLAGYKPDEVNVERVADNAKVKIHARRQEAEDFSEIRRTIEVPDTVDRTKLEVDLTREGILVVKAPYLQREPSSTLDNFNPWSMMPRRDWSSLTDEMRDLQNNMLQLYQQSFPGSMAPNFVKAADGTTQLRVNFNLSGYKPDEITVSQEGNQVSVEAKHEQKTEQGLSMKHFKRVFTLPKNVKVGEMTSKLLSDGQLRLEAPCELKEPQPLPIENEGKEIPIKRSSSKH
jgi:HSP20 family molecular chaperone IbpA